MRKILFLLVISGTLGVILYGSHAVYQAEAVNNDLKEIAVYDGPVSYKLSECMGEQTTEENTLTATYNSKFAEEITLKEYQNAKAEITPTLGYAIKAKQIAWSWDKTTSSFIFTVNPEDTAFWYCYLTSTTEEGGSTFFSKLFADVVIGTEEDMKGAAPEKDPEEETKTEGLSDFAKCVEDSGATLDLKIKLDDSSVESDVSYPYIDRYIEDLACYEETQSSEKCGQQAKDGVYTFTWNFSGKESDESDTWTQSEDERSVKIATSLKEIAEQTKCELPKEGGTTIGEIKKDITESAKFTVSLVSNKDRTITMKTKRELADGEQYRATCKRIDGYDDGVTYYYGEPTDEQKASVSKLSGIKSYRCYMEVVTGTDTVTAESEKLTITTIK